jgi:DNA-binding MarR family transcriptional regulator
MINVLSEISSITQKLDLVKTEIIRAVNDVFRKELGLTLRESRVLDIILFNSGISVSILSKKVVLEKPLLSKAICTLENNGYIKRSIDPKDNRQFKLAITKKGRVIQKRGIALTRKIEAHWLKPLTASEQNQLSRLLDRICISLRKEMFT